MDIKQVEQSILRHLGKNSSEYRVSLTSVDSRAKTVALFCFGHLARFMDFCLRHVLNISSLSHFALEAKTGMSIELISRNKGKERLNFCVKALACTAVAALVLGGVWIALRKSKPGSESPLWNVFAKAAPQVEKSIEVETDFYESSPELVSAQQNLESAKKVIRGFSIALIFGLFASLDAIQRVQSKDIGWWLRNLPYTGILSGAVLGLTGTGMLNMGVPEASKPCVCECPGWTCSPDPLGFIPSIIGFFSYLKDSFGGVVNGSLNGVNYWKQKEIKNLFFLTPLLVPLALKMRAHIQKKPEERSSILKKTFSTHSLYQASLVALALCANPISVFLFRNTGFDPSGHLMIKMVSAALLSAQLEGKNRTWYALAYAATDALFLERTVSKHHTVAESMAGLAYGAGVIALAKQIANGVESGSFRRASPADHFVAPIDF